jgi:hypothetical protein
MAKFKPGDKVKHSAKFLKSAGMVSDRGRRGVIVDAPTGMSGPGWVSVQWNDETEPQPIKEMALMKASFKGAVPGNLADNTKPSTPESQDYAVELLKQGGILPEDQNSEDYPVLTASVKREIIATLLRRRQPKLATWASRHLATAKTFTEQDLNEMPWMAEITLDDGKLLKSKKDQGWVAMNQWGGSASMSTKQAVDRVNKSRTQKVKASRHVRAGGNVLHIEDVHDLIDAMDDGYDDPVDGIAGVEGVLDLVPKALLKRLLPELKRENKEYAAWVSDWLRGKTRS